MKTLSPALAFALRLAVAAGAEPRSGDDAAAPPAADLPAGPVLLTVDEQGAIVDAVEASGIGDAICAIESSTAAAARILILLVPVTAAAGEPPPGRTAGMSPAAPAGPMH